MKNVGNAQRTKLMSDAFQDTSISTFFEGQDQFGAFEFYLSEEETDKPQRSREELRDIEIVKLRSNSFKHHQEIRIEEGFLQKTNSIPQMTAEFVLCRIWRLSTPGIAPIFIFSESNAMISAHAVIASVTHATDIIGVGNAVLTQLDLEGFLSALDNPEESIYVLDSSIAARRLLFQLNSDTSSAITIRHLEKMIQSVFEGDLISESLQPRPVPSIPFPHGAHQLDSLIRQNNIITSSLNGLVQVVTFLAQDMQSLNIQRVTQDSNLAENIGELQRRIGPIQEGLIRSRVALRLGLQWAEALEVNNLNDILDFVGTGLGAAREERIAAKRRILTALVGRESLIDKRHLIESEAFEIGDFLKVRHCKRELSDHKAVSCCPPHCLVRTGEKGQQLSWP